MQPAHLLLFQCVSVFCKEQVRAVLFVQMYMQLLQKLNTIDSDSDPCKFLVVYSWDAILCIVMFDFDSIPQCFGAAANPLRAL